MNIAFIIGHNKNNKGSYSPHLKKFEYDFYSQWTCNLNLIGDVYIHDSTIIGYTDRCKEISNRIGNDYDLVIALHFNSFNHLVGGTECYYWHTNQQTKLIATWLSNRYSFVASNDNRGSKPYNDKKELGAGEVYYPKSNAILFEPFFGDYKKDCNSFVIYELINVFEDLRIEFSNVP